MHNYKILISILLGSTLAGCSIHAPVNPNASVFDAGVYSCQRLDNSKVLCERKYD